MAMYNGKGPNYCKNCGVVHVEHRISDDACPNLGGNNTGLSHPNPWLTSTFDPQDWEKEEPADMARLPLSQEIKMEEHNLFDDYYIAALQSVGTIFSGHTPPKDSREERSAANIIASFARELAVEAIKKRALYLYGGYKE